MLILFSEVSRYLFCLVSCWQLFFLGLPTRILLRLARITSNISLGAVNASSKLTAWTLVLGVLVEAVRELRSLGRQVYIIQVIRSISMLSVISPIALCASILEGALSAGWATVLAPSGVRVADVVVSEVLASLEAHVKPHYFQRRRAPLHRLGEFVFVLKGQQVHLVVALCALNRCLAASKDPFGHLFTFVTSMQQSLAGHAFTVELYLAWRTGSTTD